MANPNPIQTEAFKAKQFATLGDRPLAEKIIGTRYPVEVYEALKAMSSGECQQLIREAVEAKLRADGLL